MQGVTYIFQEALNCISKCM